MHAAIAFFLALHPLSATAANLSPLHTLRTAQVLVAAFDQALADVRSEQEFDRLMTSPLYCRVRAFRQKSQEAEAALFRHPPSRKEVLEFARRDAAAAAAMGNWLPTAPRPELRALATRKNLGFSPANEAEFLSFLDSHRSRIIAEPVTPLSSPGCGDPPLKPQSYDWKNRNWMQGNLGTNEFVVTYDDGPHPRITREIMARWGTSGFAKPTFFWASQNAQNLPAIVGEARAQGFPIGCHSERHGDLGNLVKANSAADFNLVNRETFGSEVRNIGPGEFPAWRERTLDREIIDSARTLESVVRQTDPAFRLQYFRLPYGSGMNNTRIGDRLEAIDVDHFYWKIDSLDWQDKNPASVLRRVKKQMAAGKKGIILFHDIQSPTVKTTDLLLETFRSSSYKPVSIRQMVP